MDITLPSGATVSVKDNTVPGDRFAVQDSVQSYIEDGRIVVPKAASSQWKAFLTRVITGWSYQVPIPSVGGEQVLEEYPNTDDDIDALEDALRERYERIVNRRPTTRRQPSPTSGTSPSS
jgi:hypothetical protein